MKKLVVCAAILCSAICIPDSAFGEVPELINYQGRLVDGTNLVNGSVNIRFRIYTNELSGVFIYEATNRADVVDGLYATYIAEHTTVGTLTNVLSQDAAWLEVVINNVTLEPRERLASVAYAQKSRGVNDGAITTSMLADNSVTSLKIVDGEIAPDDLAPDAVTPDKIPDGSISPAEIDVAAFSNTFWKMDGNTGTDAGVHYLGTADSTPLVLRVDGEQALSLRPTSRGSVLVAGPTDNNIGNSSSGSSILGGSNNTIGAATQCATISGGTGHTISNASIYATIGGGAYNLIETNATYATISGGGANYIHENARSAVIGGGDANAVRGGAQKATVGGGVRNIVGTNAAFATIPGGTYNEIGNGGEAATIGGGFHNAIGDDAYFATLSGGKTNVIHDDAEASFIGGGSGNQIMSSVDQSSIVGGHGNSIRHLSRYSFIGGGFQNAIRTNALYGVIGGGFQNVIAGDSWSTPYGVIGGGWMNTIRDDAHNALIAGGAENTIDLAANYAAIGGGWRNTAGGEYGIVDGGQENMIRPGASHGSIAGGEKNEIGTNATYAVIGGGTSNTVAESSQLNVINGGSENTIGWGTIASVIGGGIINTVQAQNSYCVIDGGLANIIRSASWSSPYSSIGGGVRNAIFSDSHHSVIAGGSDNVVRPDSDGAMIPGGYMNTAGKYSFAAGYRAKATNEGSFVWADYSFADYGSSTANQFCVRASGGVKMDTGTSPGISLNAENRALITRGYDAFTNGNHNGAGRWGLFMEPHRLVLGMPALGGKEVHIVKYNANGTYTSLVWVTQSGDLYTLGTVNPPSDRNVKSDFADIDPQRVLEKVAALPLQTWRYNADGSGSRHIGPVAQDFHEAFGLGTTDKSISTVDADGVALAAIQGLHRLNAESGVRIAELERQNAELLERLKRLEKSTRP